MLKFERHRLGPRIYVFGRRIHEWHLGLIVTATGIAAGVWGWVGPLAATLRSEERRVGKECRL